jgi:hypothetical protein
MKTILTLIFLIPLITLSQKVSQVKSKPDTCFTQQEILDISFTLDSLHKVIDLQEQTIKHQEFLIVDLKQLIKLDSLHINYQQVQVDALRKNIDIYIEREKLNQPKWYDNKIIYFTGGILTTMLTSKLILDVVK